MKPNPVTDAPLIILAGGRATRLGKEADALPKFLMPVGTKTFADLQLKWAKDQGFSDVVLSVGHLADKIEAYCGNGERYKLRLHYVRDGETLLGTGGAVAACTRAVPLAEWWAVTYGDTLLSLPCAQVLEQARGSGCPALMSVYENQVAGHTCNAAVHSGRCIYSKKAPHPAWKHIDYGFLALHRDFIARFPTARPLDLAEPLEALSRQKQLAAFLATERFWEIGSPEALKEFSQQFKSATK